VINPASVNYNTNNCEVIAILMDMEIYPNAIPTINKNHVKNPQQIKFLTAKMAQDGKSPGVGPDGVYRDPWGNPYIISLDLNYDDKCWDAIYRQQNVSRDPDLTKNPSGTKGFNGLFNTFTSDVSGVGPHFAFNGGVMVWSAGPDTRIDNAGPADSSQNKDNVLSWKQ